MSTDPHFLHSSGEEEWMEAAGSVERAGNLAGNMVGIDPHKDTLSAVVLDRGGLLARSHFKVSGEGHGGAR